MTNTTFDKKQWDNRIRPISEVDPASLDDDDFYRYVNTELRRNLPALNDRERADLDIVAERLKKPDTVLRWQSVLGGMKRSAERQLGIRGADLKRHYGEVNQDEYLERRANFLSWKTGTLRFLTNLDERLRVCYELRREFFPTQYPLQMAEERNALSRELILVLRAVEHHKARIEEATDADEELWDILERAGAIIS